MLNLYYKLFSSLTNLKELELNHFSINISKITFPRQCGEQNYSNRIRTIMKENYIIFDFTFLNSLEKLKIINCKNIIHININISRLLYIFYDFKQSKYYDFVNKCNNLKSIILKNINNLKELEIIGYNQNFYDFIKQFNNLETLILKNCNNILEIPNLRNLNKLNIINCKNIIEIPDTFINLEELIIDNNNINEISKLIQLNILELINCNNIYEIPYSFINLKELKIYNCNNIKEIPDIFINLRKLIINNCQNIISIPEIYKILKYSINII